MAYSYDLRLKALACIKKGTSKIEVSKIFGINVRTLFNWINREKRGCLAPCKKRKRPPNKIEEGKLRSYIEQHPDSYLREIADIFGTSINAVFKACKRAKITLKKRHPFIKKEMSKKE